MCTLGVPQLYLGQEHKLQAKTISLVRRPAVTGLVDGLEGTLCKSTIHS